MGGESTYEVGLRICGACIYPDGFFVMVLSSLFNECFWSEEVECVFVFTIDRAVDIYI